MEAGKGYQKSIFAGVFILAVVSKVRGECSSSYLGFNMLSTTCYGDNTPFCCLQDQPSKSYCCTYNEHTYGAYAPCKTSDDCNNPAAPYCCGRRTKCCSLTDYNQENPRCTTDYDCSNVPGFMYYCCDSTSRCCTYERQKEERCNSDSQCMLSVKPRCCENSKCCTNAAYDIENKPCNSSATCDTLEKPHCCDSTARCCSQSYFDLESCYSDSDCKTTSRSKCCSSRSKCCAPPTLSNMKGISIAAVGGISLAAFISLSGFCLGMLYLCRSNPKNRREILENEEPTNPATPPTQAPALQISLPDPPQHEPKPPPYTAREQPPAYSQVVQVPA